MAWFEELFFNFSKVLNWCLFFIFARFSAMLGVRVSTSPSSALLLELASWSAISLPRMPTWLGIQCRIILVPADLKLLICCIISGM